MQVDHENGIISVRQSWLSTALRCPEEGRLAVRRPEFEDYDTDESYIGTLAHYGIEQIIRGMDPKLAEDAVRDMAASYDGELRFTKRHSMTEVVTMAIGCVRCWVRDIMPHAPIVDARTELSFKIPLFDHRDYSVRIHGTIDLVPTTTAELWDWKTSGSSYRAWEKQKYDVQSTIYSLAATSGELPYAPEFTWPTTFKFGVMVKGKPSTVDPSRNPSKIKGEIVTVTRDKAHADWTLYRIKSLVDLALDFGFDRPWPMIDDSALCSPVWCGFYSICKGVFDPR